MLLFYLFLLLFCCNSFSFVKRRFIKVENPTEEKKCFHGRSYNEDLNFTKIFNSSSRVIYKEWEIPEFLNPTLDINLLGISESSENGVGAIYQHVVASKISPLAIVADLEKGISVIDVSNPNSPKHVGSTSTGTSRGLDIKDNLVFYGGSNRGVIIADISDPSNPVVLSETPTSSSSLAVKVFGDFAFSGNWNQGMDVLNVSDPSNPSIISSFETDNSYDIQISEDGSIVCMAQGSYGATIIDVHNKTDPKLLGFFDTKDANGIDLKNDIMYIATSTALKIVSISDPTTPILLSQVNVSYIRQVYVKNNIAFVGDEFKLLLIDVNDPFNPFTIGQYPGIYGYGIATIGNQIYYGDQTELKILEISGITMSGTCQVGNYDLQISVCNEEQECSTDDFQMIIKCDELICQNGASISGDCEKCICAFGYFGEICENSIVLIFGPILLTVLVILFVIIGLFLFFLLFFLCCYKNLKKLKMMAGIKDVDVLLKEAKLEQEINRLSMSGKTNSAKIAITKSLLEIDSKEIKLIKQIGSGGSDSTVFLIEWEGKKCAYKKFRIQKFVETDQSENSFEEFEKEVAIFSSIHHPSILQFYGATINPPNIGLVLEFCKYGDIPNFLAIYEKEKGKKLALKHKLRILKEISMGMDFLHTRNIIHRDLKPENVLIDKNKEAKLMDFGLSRILKSSSCSEEEKTMTKKIGTSFYMSPEMIKGEKYSFSTDVYSYSILVYVLITENFFPYGEGQGSKVMSNIIVDENYRPKIDENDFLDCKWISQLIQQNWKYNPKERNTFKEITKIFSKNGIDED